MLQAKYPAEKFSPEASVLSPLPGFYEAIFFLARGYRLITISELDNNNNIWSATEVMDGPQRSSHFFFLTHVRYGDRALPRWPIRRVSQHSTCSTCTRHKMILKRLSSDKRARAMQMLEYQKHLVHQYQDRVKYWQARARSRLGMQPSGVSTITLVVDGMDKSKYRYPRSAVCSSKEFAGLVRPALDVSAIICHGYNVVVACSEPYVPKSSSWTTELIAHALSKVASQTDVRSCQIHIQMDNCGRENKNNTVCRFAGMMTGSGRCHSCLLSFLESGHSHEDIDQFFSTLSNLIEGRREIHTPDQFVTILDSFLQDQSVRPFEQERYVCKVDTVRDWTLEFDQSLFPLFWDADSIRS